MKRNIKFPAAKSRLVSFLRKFPIRYRLLLMTTVQILFSIALLIYIFSISVQKEIASVNNRNVHTLETASLNLQNRIDTLYSVSKYPVTQVSNRTFMYEYLSALDRNQLSLHPTWTYGNYRDDVIAFSKTMFSLYSDSVQQIHVYQPDGSGLQCLSAQDRPKGAYFDNNMFSVSVSPGEAWMKALGQERGSMFLLPLSMTGNQEIFPLRDTSLYAGRAIVDSSNRHVLGYILVRSDISGLLKVLKDNSIFPEQSFGFFDADGQQLFGDFPAERAKELLSVSSSQKTWNSFETTFQTEKLSIGGVNGYYSYSYLSGGYSLMMETPLRSIVLQTLKKQIPLFLLLAFLFLLLGFFTYQVAYSITSPLRHLQKACRKIQNGNYSATIENSGGDELSSFTDSFNAMMGEINKLIHEGYEKDLLYNQLELQMLHMQINPHFLYNTLESIHAIAYLHGEEDLSQMAVLLGKNLRYGISTPSDQATVKDELDNLMNYIHLQQLRYREQISFFVNIDESILECPVLKVILQPLVENAIYHGISRMESGGYIQILGYRTGNSLVFQVIDNGSGISEEKLDDLNGYINNRNQRFESIGLKNVNRRIQLCYGASYGLKVSSSPGRGSMVTVTIPAAYPDTAGESEKRRDPHV